jgi:hypothetical protein
MAGNLPYRRGDTVHSFSSRRPLGRHPVPRGVARQVNRAMAIELGIGQVGGAQVRAFEYVADQALQAVGRLSRTEAFHAHYVPHAAARLQAIADIAAMSLADIVAQAGQD